MKADNVPDLAVAPENAGDGQPRRFIVAERQRESDVITSFILRPADGTPLPAHKAGQHLTLFANVPGLGRQKRNYTISTAPNGETYRISVKREAKGTVSRWLHDAATVGTSVKVAPPAGSFVLPEHAARPIVLASAGVGLTPMVAMLEEIARSGIDVPVHFVHGTQNGATHAFREHVDQLAAASPDARTTVFYSRPRDTDEPGRDFDIAGHSGVEWLTEHTPMQDAEFFVCGPLGYLKDIVSGLLRHGVDASRIHYEFFGPVAELTGDDEPAATPPAPPAQEVAERRTRVIGGLTRAQIGDGLLDSAADAVVVSDAEGAIVAWNVGAERIFGFSEADALGQSLDIIIPEPFRDRHWEGYRETVASGQSRYGAGDLLAVPGLCKDGRRISIEFTIVLLKGPDGRVAGMVATVRDVTARFEEAKALKKRLKELESSGVAGAR